MQLFLTFKNVQYNSNELSLSPVNHQPRKRAGGFTKK